MHKCLNCNKKLVKDVNISETDLMKKRYICSSCFEPVFLESKRQGLSYLEYLKSEYGIEIITQKPVKQRRKTNKTLGTRVNDIPRRYGISIDDAKKLLKLQSYKCAICNAPISFKKRRYCIDHNHQTGRVRGILCPRCNIGIGWIENFYPAYKQRITTYLDEKYRWQNLQ